MNIGKLAKSAQVSRDTIRYYERIGVLPAHEKNVRNGYKEYSEATLHKLHLIRYAKRLGFTLIEIRETLASWSQGLLAPQSKAEAMRVKRTEVRAKLSELREVEAALSVQIFQCETDLLTGFAGNSF